ncbi:rhodanese-like domain-containing protein [Flavobacterium sediminis]|uniref:Rhodanese-like domain-containing protein n=2 Tax=Flavobacteriaceae TaxID=49546 RepID=A0A2U8QZH4_9FLAO|nr:rhodanese-like domain-containing protein [Flavobacterium sediminis]
MSLFVAASCVNQKQSGVEVVKPDGFETKMAEADVQLLDVRTPEEYASGHLPNAKNYNVLADDFESKVAALDKEKPVMVYCKMGGRSSKAAAKLKELGFKHITDLEGGIMSWESAEKTIVK